MKKALVLSTLAVLLASSTALADTADKRIALSNNYAGNSWRQAMLRSWDKVDQAGRRRRHRRRGRCLHHRREPGDRAGRADPEPDPAGLRRHRHQRRLARRAERRRQGSLRRRHHRRLLRRHRHRALRLAHRRRLQADGQGRGRSTSTEKLPERRQPARDPRPRRRLRRRRDLKGIHEGVAENPQFKIVGSVHGDWDQDVAQKAVAGILPSLPEIVARRDPGRRRLWRRAGLRRRRPPDPDSSSWATARTS